MTCAAKRIGVCDPGVYRICVQGLPDESWPDYYDNLAVTVDQTPGRPAITTLRARLIDQAALIGVLMHLFNSGYPILLVEHQRDL
jgi:hypothetical protein